MIFSKKPDNSDKDEQNAENAPQPEQEELTNPLIDVFEEEESTRRISLDELKAGDFGKGGEPAAEDDFELEERDYRPVRFRRDSRSGCLGGIMFAVFVISISIILACGAWMAASDVLALNKEEMSVTVTIPKTAFHDKEVEVKDADGNVTGTEIVQAADIDYVADALKDSGIIEYKSLFKLFAKLSNADTKIDPGTYTLTSDFDYRALIKNMHAGAAAQVTTRITFPEGYTMAQIFQKLEDENICSVESLYKAAADYVYDYAFLEDVGTGDPLRLEGFIFPNTYDFYEGEQASSAINKFLNALHYQITADMWNQCKNLNLSFREAVTIASMIEKEAANDDERALISSVIHNRLSAGMTLGIDATILYIHPEYTGGVDIPAEILGEDSPYNTHIYTGLPPTPICNPGMASITAALQPADTNYYYYALDMETGTHRFFTNSYEFESFVATQNYHEGA
ncbi:MAG: endolytic transglycosylase MltG [Oscillospiraceae bacterium]